MSTVAPDLAPSYPPLPALAAATPAALSALAQTLATREDLWQPMISFCREARWYTRVAGGEGWEAWLLTWLPGQGTGLHGHGGSKGAFAVLLGDLRESTPSTPVGAGQRVRLQHRVVSAGAVRAFGADHVHDVVNVARRRAVSLHVYGPALSAMTRYTLSADGVVVEVVHEAAGVDW